MGSDRHDVALGDPTWLGAVALKCRTPMGAINAMARVLISAQPWTLLDVLGVVWWRFGFERGVVA